jgi:hypothetical protein
LAALAEMSYNLERLFDEGLRYGVTVYYLRALMSPRKSLGNVESLISLGDVQKSNEVGW